jgi:hypothetical protein
MISSINNTAVRVSAVEAKLPDYIVIDLQGMEELLRVAGEEAALAGEVMQSEDLSDFNQKVAEKLQALTPRMMHWGNDFWILDLSACSSYWRARAKAARCDVLELVRSLLKEMFGNIVRAALADHPWPALLLAHQMRGRKLNGLVLSKGPFGESLMREMSWDIFWLTSDALAEHYEASGRKKFQSSAYRRQREQMKRATKRLGMRTPWQMRDITPDAIRRRFGATIKDIWDWTFFGAGSSGKKDETNNMMTSLFASRSEESNIFHWGFPWQGFVLESLPRVIRHLEVPLCEWSHIEAVLREDLDRLCGLSSWLAGERVVSLEWRIISCDLTHHIVPILFRHPHSLHPEKGNHKTALLQALYSFENNMPRQDQGYEELFHGYEAPAVPICGWELIIKERLTIPPQSTGLFGEMITADWNGKDGAIDFAFMRMENRLTISLDSYDLLADWTPEDSFVNAGTANSRQDVVIMNTGENAACRRSMLAIAKKRPLYMFREPKIFDNQGASSLREFCERTMGKWWSSARTLVGASKSSSSMQRDYYKITDKDQRRLWVFRDISGHWFLHGIYG